LLPHEEDLWGLKQLNFNNNDIIDVGASDGLCFKSIKYLGFSNNYIAFEAIKKNKKYLDKIKKKILILNFICWPWEAKIINLKFLHQFTKIFI